MNKKCLFPFCVIVLLLVPYKSYPSERQSVSPLSFGILDAKNGIDAYNILSKTHAFANSQGLSVVYKGIKEIYIEIPPDAKSIPLTSYTDFSNTKITVLNKTKDLYLFTLSDDMIPIDVTSQSIDDGYFKKTILNTGSYLLTVEDQNSWVSERVGYGGPFTRKDILFIVNGISKNAPVSPYNNKQSYPRCKYVKVNTAKKTIKNLFFYRDSLSLYKTFLFKISCQYNLYVENLSINTPENSSLYGDACIQINDSYKVKLKNINIEGTYSLSKKFGYGISMNNVSDFKVIKLNANGKWGVFGTNNISNVTITNSTLNRFDIHCYGKNIECSNCFFKELYNQYSSIFGYIKYNHCIFDKCTPVLIEPSYNAYTPFHLLIENCDFIISRDKNYVMYARKMVKGSNDRTELKEFYWPNVTINNLRIIDNDNVKRLVLIYNDNSCYNKPLAGTMTIGLNGIKYHSNNAGDSCLFKLVSQPVKTQNKIIVKTCKSPNILFEE